MKLNFAIIGCGTIAKRHALFCSQYGNLAAVCDIKPERAQELGAQYGAKAYQFIDELLIKEKKLDIITIATPNGLHAEHTIKSLKAGIHVLCEKPMAIKSCDCLKMIDAAEGAGKKIFIVKQNRYNPPVLAVKKAIDEGRLGRILSAHLGCYWNRNELYYTSSDWRGSREMDGGSLFTQFSHFVDLLFWLIGDIKEVHAFVDNFIHRNISEIDDAGVVIIKFLSGVLGSIHFTVNSFEKNMEGSLTIFGENGTVKIAGRCLNELEFQSIKDYEIKGLAAGNPSNQYGYYEGSMSNHEDVYKNVIETLQNNGKITTSGFDGMKTVEIIEKIYLKANRSR